MKHILTCLLLWMATVAPAADFYVGPNGTATGGDGSITAPYSSIGAAFKSGKVVGGDTLLLLNGNYGDVRITGVIPASPVVIKSATYRKAVFDRLELYNTSNLTFDGIALVWTKPAEKYNDLFYTDWQTKNIVIQRSNLKGHPTSSIFRYWTKEQWNANAIAGITLNGSGHKALRNNIVGIGFGITVSGNDALIERNTVNGFSGDGLRGNGDRITFRANRVTNCVQVNGNHADGFQSFNLAKDGSLFDDLLIEQNTIIENTYVTRMPLACQLQGIGMFDGMWGNLTIQNNHVEMSAYHGIAVAGVVGAKIVNNTVALSPNPASRARPWIMVSNHKDGRPSSGILIANNISVSKVTVNSKALDTIVASNALTGAPTLDLADPAYAPPVDITGRKRVVPDIGAREAN